MAGGRNTPLNEACETSLDSLHEGAEGLRANLNQQVKMIRHPTIGVHARAGALQSGRHDFIRRLAITTLEEDVLSMIATRGDMVDGAGRMEPRQSRYIVP